MKDDSLLSSLSNMSYQAGTHSNDIFGEEPVYPGHPDFKFKVDKDEEEINFNSLQTFAQNEPLSPKNNGFMSAGFWTIGMEFLNRNDDNVSEFEDECLQLQPNQQKQMDKADLSKIQKGYKNDENGQNKVNQKPKKQIQQVNLKMEIQKNQQSSDSKEVIGTVIKNQTKNIPKNYGKAIITYIEREKQIFCKVLQKMGINYEQFIQDLSSRKKYINTIANLRDLWVDFKYAKAMRVLSNQFLRKYALQYIFNSRICNYISHVKYRRRLQQAISSPLCFKHIKQY